MIANKYKDCVERIYAIMEAAPAPDVSNCPRISRKRYAILRPLVLARVQEILDILRSNYQGIIKKYVKETVQLPPAFTLITRLYAATPAAGDARALSRLRMHLVDLCAATNYLRQVDQTVDRSIDYQEPIYPDLLTKTEADPLIWNLLASLSISSTCTSGYSTRHITQTKSQAY